MALPASIDNRGWAFPPQFELEEGVVLAKDYIEDIQQSLRILFNTLPLERIIHSWYGCDLHALVFENVNADLLERIKVVISRSIAEYEPRVSLNSVVALFGDDSVPGTGGLAGINVLRVQVSYRIRGTDPVYVEEGLLDVSDGQAGYFA